MAHNGNEAFAVFGEPVGCRVLLEFSPEAEKEEGKAERKGIGDDGADEKATEGVEEVDDGRIDENA